MQAASATLSTLLAANTRKPWVEIQVQFPNPNNALQMGSSIVLDGVIAVTIQRNSDPSADTLDFELANGDGRYSTLRVV